VRAGVWELVDQEGGPEGHVSRQRRDGEEEAGKSTPRAAAVAGAFSGSMSKPTRISPSETFTPSYDPLGRQSPRPSLVVASSGRAGSN